MSDAEDVAQLVEATAALVRDLHRVVESLEALHVGRKFTPDGHLVGSLGEVAALALFDITLHTSSNKGCDAITPSTRRCRAQSGCQLADRPPLVSRSVITPPSYARQHVVEVDGHLENEHPGLVSGTVELIATLEAAPSVFGAWALDYRWTQRSARLAGHLGFTKSPDTARPLRSSGTPSGSSTRPGE